MKNKPNCKHLLIESNMCPEHCISCGKIFDKPMTKSKIQQGKKIIKRDYKARLVIYDLNDNKENVEAIYWWLINEAGKIRKDYKQYDPKMTIFRLMK